MYPAPGETVLKLRHKTFYSVLYLVAGVLFLLNGLIALIDGRFGFGLVPGILFTVGGAMTFGMPAFTYEYATGALHAHALFGYRVRTYGPPKGERLWFDGEKVVRLRQSGNPRKVNLRACNPEDVQRLLHLLAARQQHEQQQQAPQQ
ncbi:hypothetical protein [Glycomyces sp. NRRL B-16210]|uniref:hypothetical protein n=1 Tax=Glycomyces sp. NRRL B-16210 TaxID=1463821 RepID=UPI0004C01108|nr:hypothetical protein [Glycomyces sp. NRRL B-16210]